jgi:predicted O-linked N-acetylglucosamine transferase (SPINDLY family)
MPTVGEVMAAAVQQHQTGNLAEAERLYRLVLQARPQHVDAMHMLGLATSQLGRPAEAAALLEQAMTLRPDVPHIHTNLGLVYQALGKFDAAVDQHHEAIRLAPAFAGAHYNLGTVLREQGNLDDARASYGEALRLEPAWPMPLNNLAGVLMEMGLVDEALASYRRLVELEPDSPYSRSNLYYALHFACGDDQELLARERRAWYERFARPLESTLRPHANIPDPERRLRVGYLCTTFHYHPVARFLLPLLEQHDHRAFEIFCYNSGATRDAVTDRLRPHPDHWREVAHLTDERLAEYLREEGIDILVDLTHHVGVNRLLTFARKPAPVQITYLACCSSTGLPTIDYRFSDSYMDPPDQRAPDCSEETIHLPGTYWCYQPSTVVGPPAPLPALTAGQVTFGCLNNFCKITPTCLNLLRDLMERVPDSRLLLHARPGSHRDRVRQFFAEREIAPERIEFSGYIPAGEYLRVYDRIDIGLDAYPYTGGTTTCDSLWMGVPVITLAGKVSQSRTGVSILSNIGLPELVAQTPEEFVHKAMNLANDLPSLSILRAGLRERLQKSPLTDAPRYARHIEATYRNLWREWCRQK